jgi:hypothetical protein
MPKVEKPDAQGSNGPGTMSSMRPTTCNNEAAMAEVGGGRRWCELGARGRRRELKVAQRAGPATRTSVSAEGGVEASAEDGV